MGTSRPRHEFTNDLVCFPLLCLLVALELTKANLTRLPSNRRPFPHPYQDVAANAKATTAALTPTDPFIYNPKKGPAAAKSRPVIVQNEVAEVYVTLQNTFLFELEIQSIELSFVALPLIFVDSY